MTTTKTPQDANEGTIGAVASTAGLGALLAPKHTGMKISAEGMLGRIRDGRYYDGLNYGCGVMLGHLEEMARRFYSGDVKVVDEFLQLYDLDEHRPALNEWVDEDTGEPRVTPRPAPHKKPPQLPR